MWKSKKLTKIIDVIYWGIILFTAIKSTVAKNWTELPTDFSNAQLIGFAAITFLISVFGSFLQNFELSLFYFGWKIAYKKFIKDKLDKVDFKNDSYYRKILKDIPVGVLSYLDDFNLEDKDIIATIMSLELKGYIKIGDSIEILKDDELLTNSERYIIDKLKNGNLEDVYIEMYRKEVIKDAIDAKLLETGDSKRKLKITIIRDVIIFLLAFIGYDVFSSSVDGMSINDGMNLIMFFIIGFGGVIFLAAFPIISIFKIRMYLIMSKLNPYIRTKSGMELNEKLEGLKKYIKDFSSMEEREKEDMVLWEEYLIYSVIFGINEKIVEEYKEKLNK